MHQNFRALFETILDYEQHMLPSFGQYSLALKKCLRGESLDRSEELTTIFEMFHRLDLKYGSPEKLSNAVLCELKSLKVIRGGDNLM